MEELSYIEPWPQPHQTRWGWTGTPTRWQALSPGISVRCLMISWQNEDESLQARRRRKAVISSSCSSFTDGRNVHVSTHLWSCKISCPVSRSAKLNVEATFQCAETLLRLHTYCICSSTGGSSNNNVNKMRLPALPKLPRCCCSDPLNSTAISAIQSNQSRWGWWRGYRRSKICTAIFSAIIDNRGLIRNLSNFKTHILGADVPWELSQCHSKWNCKRCEWLVSRLAGVCLIQHTKKKAKPDVKRLDSFWYVIEISLMWKILKLVRCVSGNYFSRECGGGGWSEWWEKGNERLEKEKERWTDRETDSKRMTERQIARRTKTHYAEEQKAVTKLVQRMTNDALKCPNWEPEGIRGGSDILYFGSWLSEQKKEKSSKKKFHRTFIVLYLKYSYHVDAYSLLLPRWGTCPALSGCLAFPWCGCIV